MPLLTASTEVPLLTASTEVPLLTASTEVPLCVVIARAQCPGVNCSASNALAVLVRAGVDFDHVALGHEDGHRDVEAR